MLFKIFALAILGFSSLAQANSCTSFQTTQWCNGNSVQRQYQETVCVGQVTHDSQLLPSLKISGVNGSFCLSAINSFTTYRQGCSTAVARTYATMDRTRSNVFTECYDFNDRLISISGPGFEVEAP